MLCMKHVRLTLPFLHKCEDLQTHRLPQLPAVLKICPLPWDAGQKQFDVIVPQGHWVMGSNATGDVLGSWASLGVLQPPEAGQSPGDGLGLAAQ